jgi:glutamate dehydrogenase
MAKAQSPKPLPFQSDIEKILTTGALPGEVEGFPKSARADAARWITPFFVKRTQGKAVIAESALPGSAHGRRLVVINTDKPFLVDSIAAALVQQGRTIRRILHPVAHIVRTEKGVLKGFSKKRSDETTGESILYFETDGLDPIDTQAIDAVLNAVHSAVRDWPKMKRLMQRDAENIADAEQSALLAWFNDNHFTMLGAMQSDAKGEISNSIGIARPMGHNLLSQKALSRAFKWCSQNPARVLILKSNALSPVHRAVPIEIIIVPLMEKGKVTALSIHAGLWTSSALNASPDEIPVLRQSLARMQTHFGFDPAGHAGKALAHSFTVLPNDVLIAMNDDALEAVTLAAMSIADRPRPKLALTASPLDRHVHAFVWLPRDDLNTGRRIAIGAKLAEAADGPEISWSLDLDEGGVALIRYVLDIRDGGTLPDAEALNTWLKSFLRGWQPAVEAELGASSPLITALPGPYRDTTDAMEAAADINALSTLNTETTARVFMRGGMLRLKLYSKTPIILSDAVPSLENFGFRVLEDVPTALLNGEGFIHDFGVALASPDEEALLLSNRTGVEAAITGVLSGAVENDRFNALMVTTGLDAQGATLMRALFRYLRQTGMSYGLLTVVDVLRRSAIATQALITLFTAQHDPKVKGRKNLTAEASATIETALSKITALDDDRILRQLRAVILATLRTNAFATSAQEALAFKLDSAKIPGLPAPVPWREIFVYSPRVEGIHLRAGPIARGGLRWSDRRDDFRTEILGLMKAQRVKNAVIVPTGAKGGFYPKLLPDPTNRDAWIAEGTESYRIFIRTLLSITDNLVDQKVVHPADVVCHDGDDPYFVVAADKGTASFSDVANAIAIERGFWLGDAFASGGSVGYDHKAMGITAKGGWVSVRRHFAEMGVDVQSDPVRVAGCGDMSGDVFGNGMLLSKSIKLVAAFDHRHIFFDPDPDPTISWKERERLFKLPRSSWADYTATLISKGGGVFPRSAKIIPLSPEIQALLGVTADALEPSAVISALLKMHVDLMWFGGIGTYIKAKAQSHADVGDRANDAHRVNAEDLRCSVIGEGANLGVTQEARIVFGLKGGRINTDFIDNSAGVDCSDNEVNIKIALNSDMAAGRIAMKARNALLARMTDDVAELVLEDNRLQTLALSIAQRDEAGDLRAYIRIIETLEAHRKLDRAVEGIATNEELLRRVPEGKGLTRAELAVLLATAKLTLQDGIEDTGLGQDPSTYATLMAAFPLEMQRKHKASIEGHRLRSEIIATKLSNRIINRMGVIHPFELADEEGATLGDVAEAFVIAEQIFDIPALWSALDKAQISEDTRLMVFDQIAIEMRAHMADILRNAIEERSNDQAIKAYRPVIDSLAKTRKAMLRPEAQRQAAAFAAKLAAAGTPKLIADKLVLMAELDGCIGLAALSSRNTIDPVNLTRGFTALGDALGIDWAQGAAMQLDPQDPWERLLTAGTARDFQAMRLDFLARIGGKKPDQAVERWLASNAGRVQSFRAMIERAKSSGLPSPAMLAQISGQARVLLSR